MLHMARNYPFGKAIEVLDLEMFMASSSWCEKPTKRATMVRHNQRNAKNMRAIAPTPKAHARPPKSAPEKVHVKKLTKPAIAKAATTYTTSTTDNGKIAKNIITSPISEST